MVVNVVVRLVVWVAHDWDSVVVLIRVGMDMVLLELSLIMMGVMGNGMSTVVVSVSVVVALIVVGSMVVMRVPVMAHLGVSMSIVVGGGVSDNVCVMVGGVSRWCGVGVNYRGRFSISISRTSVEFELVSLSIGFVLVTVATVESSVQFRFTLLVISRLFVILWLLLNLIGVSMSVMVDKVTVRVISL